MPPLDTPLTQHRVVPDNKPSNQEFDSWSFVEQREWQTTGKRPARPNSQVASQ